MTTRTLSRRARRAATLAALVLVLLAAVPVRGASAVDIEVRALVGGRYQISGWLALSVTLVNSGAPTDGYLSAETDGGIVRRFVDMPAGARKVVSLYIEPEAFQREVTVTYTEPNGSVTSTAEIRVLEQLSSQVAIVGDATGTLRPQILASSQVRPEPLSLTVADIPERPEPLGGISAIVWAADSTGLTSNQLGSLERWASDGGTLLVIGGADWQTRTAGLTELLPLSGLASVDGTSLAALAGFAGQAADTLDPATVSHGTLRDDARAIVTSDDGTILASIRPFGAGEVVLVGADLAVESFRSWPGAATLWDRLVPSTAIFDQFFGGAGIRDEMLGAMNGALGTLPTLQVPPVELLLGVIVGYILLIGPVSYLVLRRVDRRELAWVTAPLLIVVFSACSYGIGRSIKGSDVIVNQISVLRTTPTGTALAETYAGVFSPDRATYDLAVDADALLGAIDSSSFDGIPRATSSVVVEQGQPARLRDLSVSAFGFAGVQASALVSAEQALSLSWEWRDGELVGTVTNTSDVEIADVAYIGTSGGRKIGTLAPGASAEVRPSSTNFSGSSASDQVYGFGGFNDGTDQQRLVALRRQVIDALVGYGGWGGIELGGASGRGPYVIGWRTDEGPMPVEVEDTTTQRHTAVVEVIPATPSIGTGEVRIRPHQMSVTLSDTEGDVAGGFEAGSVIINDGSATFTIGLPLAATGLVPTDIEIIVGPDPTVIFGNPGDFVGFWPDGFTLEARDVASGTWVPLGGLNEASSFDLFDPGRFLGPTGLIDVRVSGRTDPNFGQSGVFVSATVAGVIDR